MKGMLAAFAQLLGVVFVAAPLHARSPDAAECEAAHQAAQELREQTRLLAAREKLFDCAAQSCPGLIQDDCAEWLEEVQENIPTLVLAARTATGEELVEVRVLDGDRVLAERLEGKPIELDPGSYSLRFETEGAAPVTVRVVARAGMKNHVVSAVLTRDAVADEEEEEASPPVAFWVLGAVGTVALASFGTFAILGQKQYSDLQDECAPGCDPDDSDSVRTKFLIADVSLGVAALAYAGAAYFYFRAPARDSGAARVGVRALPGGGVATLGARF
jgi:hypothetical protein